MEKPIQIRGLSKSFASQEILKNVDLDLEPGENMVIMGKSGIGKSVLLKCIVALILPDQGSIRIFGNEMEVRNQHNLAEIRQRVGYLFQGGAVYDSMSVRQNLDFSLRRTSRIREEAKIDELVVEALENVGLEGTMDKRPSELSGGMRKRLALARTIIMKPDVILYDEPTTGLDPVTSGEISELMLRIQESYNTSSIIITHDIKCARITANHIKMLKDGGFFAEGSFHELRQMKDREIRSYFD